MVSINKENQILIENKYKLLLQKKLGNGAFGDVYQGINIITHSNVAIKIESRKNPHQQLKNEYLILNYLKGIEGIPNSYYYLQCNDYNCLVMDYLGPNLESLLTKCNHHFSLNTVVLCGLQMRIEHIHKLHIIHRDIKPENFLIGINSKRTTLYLTDFGLSKRFRNPKTGEHIPYKDGKHLTGTPRFASIYTHLGIEQSRRDDLESFIYTLIYLYKGSLPWQSIPSKNKEDKYIKMMEKKINIEPDELLQGLPCEFKDILIYTRNLQFEEMPDYKYIKSKLLNVIDKYNLSLEITFEWADYGNSTLISDKSSKESSNTNKRVDEIKKCEKLQIINA